jgi:hypothetical protein
MTDSKQASAFIGTAALRERHSEQACCYVTARYETGCSTNGNSVTRWIRREAGTPQIYLGRLARWTFLCQALCGHARRSNSLNPRSNKETNN